MRCENCDFENPSGMKYCGRCATPLKRVCPHCNFANPTDFSYCGQCGRELSATTKDQAPGTTSYQHGAERRQLTMLFCDMIGSSSLSEKIDPEDLRDIMCEYRNTCSEIVARYHGHVAQYLGDGILVYFGYPHANEDDARRAVQAALEITRHISQSSYRISPQQEIQLAVRVGVHTGLVVVGEMGGGDKRNLALGETPNIAARLQDLAPANGVIISDTTHRLIEKYIRCTPLGAQPLKGFTQPMQIYQVESEYHSRRANMNAVSSRHVALVGRDQETNLLLERLEQARKGVGQVVLLNGEPGLGKTRMVQLVCEKLRNEPCYLLECAGSPYYQHSFLAPIIELGEEILGLDRSLSNQEKLTRLEQAVATLGLDGQQALPLLAELFSLDIPSHYPAISAATPQQKKQQIMDTIIQVLQAMAMRKLVVLIIEDLQWMDASSLELLSRLIEQPGLTNLFVLITFRNEYSPPWTPHANLTQVTLNRLTRQQSGNMIRQLSKGKTLPEEVFSEIINKTDGIPYFVEELTHMVLQSDMLQEKDDHYELTASMAALSIPATLHDSLMSRLDCLGEDKELAQISATLGREFPHSLLRAVSERDEHTLQQGLNRLINAELFFQRGQPPQSSYSFRHALLREAAYHSLLRRTRQKYHQRIAKLLKEQFADIITSKPELLAHHCMEAGEFAEAVEHWLQAGRRALKRSANREAAAHLQQGLTALEQLPENVQRQELELTFQTNLGLAIMMSEGYADKGVERAYARAHDLCQQLNEANAVFPVLCGLWEYHIVRADLGIALQLAEELQAIADKAGNSSFSAEAQRIHGTTFFWQGKLQQALELLAPINETLPQAYSADSLVPYCQDAHVAALANTACVLFLLGESDLGLEHAQQALELAKRLAHPFSQAYALHFLGTLHQLRGEHNKTQFYAEAQIALSETYDFSFWVAAGKMLHAWAASYLGTSAKADISSCSEKFIRAFNDYEISGNRLARSYFMALLADIHVREGHRQQAQQIIEQALLEAEQTGEGFFTAELLRLNTALEQL